MFPQIERLHAAYSFKKAIKLAAPKLAKIDLCTEACDILQIITNPTHSYI